MNHNEKLNSILELLAHYARESNCFKQRREKRRDTLTEELGRLLMGRVVTIQDSTHTPSILVQSVKLNLVGDYDMQVELSAVPSNLHLERAIDFEPVVKIWVEELNAVTISEFHEAGDYIRFVGLNAGESYTVHYDSVTNITTVTSKKGTFAGIKMIEEDWWDSTNGSCVKGFTLKVGETI